MDYLLTKKSVVQIDDSTAEVDKYVGYQPSMTPVVERWASFPITTIWPEKDEFNLFLIQGACDILKEIGPISKEDYDYYESL